MLDEYLFLTCTELLLDYKCKYNYVCLMVCILLEKIELNNIHVFYV